MVRLSALASFALLLATPATAATVTSGTFSGAAGETVVVDIPMFTEPGRYRGSVTFSAAAADLYLVYGVMRVSNFFCDFGDGFVNCGGDDVPVGFDVFAGPVAFAALDYRIEPESRIDVAPDEYIISFDQAIGARFEYTFADAGTVSFTATTAAIPEPSSWAILITGFGLAGVALRHRRKVAPRARLDENIA